jgi:hypothetical protein
MQKEILYQIKYYFGLVILILLVQSCKKEAITYKISEVIEKYQVDSLYFRGTLGKIINHKDTTVLGSPCKYYTWQSYYDSTVRQNGYHFGMPIDFKKKLKEIANFDNSIFEYRASFCNDTFVNQANFRNTKFQYEVYFNQTKFKSSANFHSCLFDYRLICFQSVFDSTVNFTAAKFGFSADFRYSTFNSQVIFDRAILPQYLNFSEIKTKEDIDLTNCDYKRKTKIILYRAPIEKIRLQYKYFILCWLPEQQKNPEEKLRVYELLLAQTKQLGYLDSYETLDKEYINFKYTELNFPKIGEVLSFIDNAWWGYGYDKERILYCTFSIFLFFVLINLFLLPNLVKKVYRLDEFIGIEFKLDMITKSTYLLYSIYYTASIFFGIKYDINKLKVKQNLDSKGWSLFYLCWFFLMYLTGLICIAFIVNFLLSK